MSDTIRIAIVEDNKAFSESLQQIIDCTDAFSCSAVFGNAEECLDSLGSDSMQETDLILLDLNLPGRSGLALVPPLKQQLPNVHILILTQNDDYLTTLEAIRLGVSGYILKSASIAEIRTSVKEVNDGECVIDPQLSRLVLQTLNEERVAEDQVLSPRERQVLELMAMGFVKKEVADRLEVSYSAVALYTENIYKKLQVPNVAAAVATAIRKGLI